MLFYLLIIFHLFAYQGKAEEYYIVQTKGDIIVKKTGRTLKKGDKINANEEIEFRPTDAKAIVISSQKGTFVLQKPQDKSKKEGELWYIVKSSLITSNGIFGTRDGPINSIIDLKTHLTKGIYLVLDTARISINAQAIPLSDEVFFFIRYIYNEQTINKKLKQQSSYLLIDRSILSIDGQKVPADSCEQFTLYLRNEKKNESVPVARFSPVFPDMEELNAEAKLIIQVLQQTKYSKEEIQKEVNNFINVAYGQPSEKDFSAWIERLL
jgi:hypothetical protein